MIYLITFILSIAACYTGKTFEHKKKYKPFSLLAYGIAVAVLVILAGCRDYTIGTDIRIYGNPLFYAACRYRSFSAYFTDYFSWAEVGYLALNYIVSRLTATPHWFFACVALVICLGFFIGIYRMKGHISLTYSWILFILLFYGPSFNLMRQMMAMAILFMGSIHLLNRKYVRFLPYVIVGTMFHQTLVVFAVAVIVLMIAVTTISRSMVRLLVITGAVVFVFGYERVLQFLLTNMILNEKYSRYFLEASGTIGLNPIIQRAFPIVLFTIFAKEKGSKEGEKDSIGNFLMINMIVDLILVTMGKIYASSMSRIAFYFSIFNLYGYPYFLNKVRSPKNRTILSVVLIVMFAGIWIYQFVYRGNAEIYPYTSEVLGIG